jgi:hypothetical protein
MNNYYPLTPYVHLYRGPKGDERFGLLLPFLTGAVISAPFWFTLGLNRQPYPPYMPPYPYPQAYPTYAPTYSPIYITPRYRPRPYFPRY